jgi:hypothetical protein
MLYFGFALTALSFGCGVNLNEQGPSSDGAIGSRMDASVDSPMVDAAVVGPFGIATKIAGLATNGAAEDDVTLNREETELIFAINLGNGNKDLYSTRRANLQAAWAAPAAITALNTGGSDSAARLSGDGLTLYYGSVRGGASEDVWFTQRASSAVVWGTPTRMSAVNSGASDRWYNPCGGRYVLVSDRTVAGDFDLFEGVDGQAATRLALSIRGSDDVSPFLTADCLTMYWAHDNDLYLATRASLAEPWVAKGLAADLSLLNSSEQDPWMSIDRHRMYFASTADGEFDLYLATR